MRRIMLAPRHAFLLMAALIMLSLSACQTEATEPTPGAIISPVYTATPATVQQVPAVPFVLVTATSAPVPNTGATVIVPATGGGAGSTDEAEACQNAAFLSDVTVPDGTVVAPGQTFVKTWAVANTGTCPWSTGDRLVLVNGEPMGGSEVPLAGTVLVGQTANLSVNLTAPVVPGNYSGTWRLQDAAGNYFGDVVTVVITVSGAAAPVSP